MVLTFALSLSLCLSRSLTFQRSSQMHATLLGPTTLSRVYLRGRYFRKSLQRLEKWPYHRSWRQPSPKHLHIRLTEETCSHIVTSQFYSSRESSFNRWVKSIPLAVVLYLPVAYPNPMSMAFPRRTCRTAISSTCLSQHLLQRAFRVEFVGLLKTQGRFFEPQPIFCSSISTSLLFYWR